jgi:hypothetical protein
MTPAEIKLLRLEESALKNLDVIFAHHGIYAIMGVVWLWVLLIVWVIVDISRRRAKGHRLHIRPVIFIETPAPPRPPEPPSEYPLWQRERDLGNGDD